MPFLVLVLSVLLFRIDPRLSIGVACAAVYFGRRR